ncbi:MAG: peptide chain release factor N(5)-glutamine methyltransferase [Pseudomonadota bacterium]
MTRNDAVTRPLLTPPAPAPVTGLLTWAVRHMSGGQANHGGAGFEIARLEAELMLAEVMEVTRSTLLLKTPMATDRERACFADLVARRRAGEPLAYLIKRKSFWEDEFYVKPGVLIPRADSETMLRALQTLGKRKGLTNRKLRIVDLGTGSGCLGLSLLREWPNALALGVDASEEAIDAADINAQLLDLRHRFWPVQADWESALRLQQVDILISNPPYIPREEIAELDREVSVFEPHLALDGGDDGLDYYRRIVDALLGAEKCPILIAVEIGADQADQVSRLFAALPGDRALERYSDLGGRNRIIISAERKLFSS